MSVTSRNPRSSRKRKRKTGIKVLPFSQVVNTLSVTVALVLITLLFFGMKSVPINIFSANIDAKSLPPALNKKAYDARMLALARSEPYAPFSAVLATTTNAHSSNTKTRSSIAKSTTTNRSKTSLWPAHAVYPMYGAIFPFNRVIAYYGNFYSKKMGVLGEYPREEMLAKLEDEVSAWRTADPTTSVIPAIDYIAVTAQSTSGFDGMYRARMPDAQIKKALSIAREVHGVLILDVQVGLSTLEKELPFLREFLKQPDVELAIDPEFSMMKSGRSPGRVIGTVDAKDINYATKYLAKLVKEYKLPPKFLVVHRFTEAMVTNYKKITPLPEVQIVMDMDGWGSPARKRRTYRDVIYREPVQFTGFKLFYKNDIKPPSDHLMTPKEVLKLTPRPVFIQYQ